MPKTGIFWIFYGQFTAALRTLASFENFAAQPLLGYYPPQSNKNEPQAPSYVDGQGPTRVQLDPGLITPNQCPQQPPELATLSPPLLLVVEA